MIPALWSDHITLQELWDYAGQPLDKEDRARILELRQSPDWNNHDLKVRIVLDLSNDAGNMDPDPQVALFEPGKNQRSPYHLLEIDEARYNQYRQDYPIGTKHPHYIERKRKSSGNIAQASQETSTDAAEIPKETILDAIEVQFDEFKEKDDFSEFEDCDTDESDHYQPSLAEAFMSANHSKQNQTISKSSKHTSNLVRGKIEMPGANFDDGPYARITDGIVLKAHKELTYNQFVVWLVMNIHNGGKQKFQWRPNQISELTGIGIKQIYDILHALTKLKWITQRDEHGYWTLIKKAKSIIKK